MIKICHLRGNKNYWCDVKRTKFKALATWEKIRGFNFLDYRKKIRDVIIRSIIDSNEYDIICLNDEEFEQVINKINNKDIISIHSQDDDDIYLGGIIHNNLKHGIYNAPCLVLNHRNSIYIADGFKEVEAAKLLQGQRSGHRSCSSAPKRYTTSMTGSCNLIMIGHFYIFKNILKDIAKNSLHTRNRINRFIFNQPKPGSEIYEYKRHTLPIKYISNPVNLEFKHFFSYTCVHRLDNSTDLNIDNTNLKLVDEIMCDLFCKEYSYIKNLNIKDVVYWNDIKEIYNNFCQEINITCKV